MHPLRTKDGKVDSNNLESRSTNLAAMFACAEWCKPKSLIYESVYEEAVLFWLLEKV